MLRSLAARLFTSVCMYDAWECNNLPCMPAFGWAMHDSTMCTCSFCFEVTVGSCLTLHLCVSRAIPDLTLYVRLFKCFIAMVGSYLMCVSVGSCLTMLDLASYVFVQMLHCNGLPDSCFASASFACASVGLYMHTWSIAHFGSSVSFS